MSWQLTHDALTGLISRREFERRLDLLVEEAHASGGQHALLYLDLDQFKVVNDTSGHLAGDELLKQLGFLFSEQMRRNDILGRLGGDEFAALLENCPVDKAMDIAEKMRATAADFRFIWQDKTFDVGASIGVAMIGQETASAQEAMRAADVACYAAKEKGRNRVERYRPSSGEAAHRRGEITLAAVIRAALENDHFVLYAQEIRGLAAQPGSKYEVLIRMADPYGSLVMPDVFIPTAERYGLMPAVDRWVIEHTFRALAEVGQVADKTRLSINLSGLSLVEEGMLEFIRERMAHYHIDATRLIFEITETAAVAHLSLGVRFMQALAESGCQFSLDDFGSGMSSFAYLKSLPVQQLKIDGAFVRDMLADPVDRAFVEAIHRIGHLMGMQTVAEYVESEDLMDAILEIGIDHAQGYAVARPRPLEAVLRGL
jgi:diguanylate cyclase (GGDEF)-like protein